MDEAESTAKLIAKITTLEKLFNESVSQEDASPSTGGTLMAEYASDWLKLQFLSEVLQSNLQDIRFLWFESELSLHFTRDEVVDLIKLSFVDNANSRAAIKDIMEKPLRLGEANS